jgi:hypothetical protein
MLNANIGRPVLIKINGECYDQIKKPHFSISMPGAFLFLWRNRSVL